MDPLLADLIIEPSNRSLRDLVINYYHFLGYSNAEILGSLLLINGCALSKRQLARILARQRSRLPAQPIGATRLLDSISAIWNTGGRNIGYRMMRQRLKMEHGLNLSHHTVRLALRIIDPEGVDCRRKHRLRRRNYENNGPNHVIHIDGYDKLKKYGISIHGAVDGYSRKILWLEACNSNKNPRYVARFFLNYIQRIGGVPTIVRCDRGTENCLIRDFQKALRYNHTDNAARNGCFMYGKSSHNQRVEFMWSSLRGLMSEFWMNYFADLCDSGQFDDSDPVHAECIRFCFLPIIQAQLDNAALNWNCHRIRKQRNRRSPCAKPELLYTLPEAFGGRECKLPLLFSSDEVAQVKVNWTDEIPDRGCSDEFLQIANIVLQGSTRLPETVDEAYRMYEALMRTIERF